MPEKKTEEIDEYRDPLHRRLRRRHAADRHEVHRIDRARRATTSRPFPTIPAEIRAPAGTLAGVSGFQIHFSSKDIRTPADRPDVLVAFNPAALRANVDDVRPGGMVIINSDAFNEKSLARAGYTRRSAAGAARPRQPGRDPAHAPQPRGADRT